MKSNLLTFSNFCSKISELTLFYGVYYTFLGLVFFVAGVLLIFKLKIHVEAFYTLVKGKIWMATIILSITSLIRGILNLIRYFTALNDRIYYSQQDNTSFAPAFLFSYFILSDVFPMLAQLLSMIFGLIRNREDKKMNSLHQQVNDSSHKKDSRENMYDQESVSSMHSVNTQYFDPPIENYMILNQTT